jgi:peptide/nickel transport system substrate-binding protein
MVRLRLSLVLLGFVAAIGVAAQSEGTTLVVVMSSIEGTLDPAFNSNDPDTAFSRALFDYFLEPLPDGGVAPNLALDWTVSDDGLTYTFTMTDAASFHDGTPVTSADVVWTYNRLRDPALGSPAASLLSDIVAVDAPDATTVVFTLAQPNAEFLINLANRWSLIVKADTDDFSAGNISSIGSGPFELESYLPGLDAVFFSYADYWNDGKRPTIDQLVFRYESSPRAQIDALLNGEAQFAFKLPVEVVLELEGVDGITLISKPTNQHPVVRLRTDIGIGRNPDIRQAFKLATDRAQINEMVLGGFGIVANNDPIGPRFDVYPGDLPTPYDPQAACDLLSAAGYGNPAVLTATLHAPDALNYADLAAALQTMWAEGCILVDVVVQPESTYYAQTWLEVELGITGWGDRPSPQQVLEEAYLSTGQFNETRWNNPTLDRLILEARALPLEERQPIYTEIAAVFAEEGAVIVPYFAPIIGAVTDDVVGLEMAGFPGLTDFRTVTLR